MSEFDPSKPAMVHDQLNDNTLKWHPERMAENYREYAGDFGPGVISWDGLLLDGWQPLVQAA